MKKRPKKHFHCINIILFFVVIIILVSPSAAQESIIILNSSDVPTMLQNVKYIESFGGIATHRFPPHILIGDIPAEQSNNLIGHMNIVNISSKPVNPDSVSMYGRTAEIAVGVWNNNYMGKAAEVGLVPTNATRPSPIFGDMLFVPENASFQRRGKLSSQSISHVGEPAAQKIPYGAGPYDTSEYMIGDIAVGIILLESNGSIDTNTEDWTAGEESNVVSEIQAGLNWWKAYKPSARLTFTYDIHYKLPTSYEPISRNGPTGSPSGQSLWITDAMTNLGYTAYPQSWYFDNVRDYDNGMRITLNTDWAYTIFVVDSSNDIDGEFLDGYSGYAYFGGPFAVITYDNGGYGIGNMDYVIAHETGHIFYATDEYNGITENSGYLNAFDIESSGFIMDCALCWDTSSGTALQLGWKDTDVDGILDIIDFPPSSTLNAYSPDPTNDNTPTYTGKSTSLTTYPNTNPYGWGNDITINKITSVQYKVDSGPWTSASPVDGSFNSNSEDFTFTTSTLSDGTHTIYVRAQNTGGNWETVYASDTLTIDAIAAIISFVSPTPSNNSNLTLNYVYINVTSNENLITPKLEWNGVNESISGSGMNWYKNKTGLSDGNYRFRVLGNDLLNNWNATELRVVTVDTRPPIVIANPTGYPADQTASKNGGLITLNATITDLLTGVKNATVNASQINSSLGNVVLNYNSGFWTNSSVRVTASNGIYYLNITAFDYAGNRNNTVQITVIVDNSSPIINSAQTDYPIGFSAAKNGTTITLNTSISDSPAGVKNATINASQINRSIGNVVLSYGNGFGINSSVIVNASDGTYKLNITAYDNASNLNNTSQITVIVDNTRPNVTINPISYQRGIAANTGSIMTFNISASDPVINSTSSGLRNASVNASMINNTGWITLTNQSGFWKCNATVDKSIPDGNYSLNVTFFDNAGNINSSEWKNITIDNTPPSVGLVLLYPYFVEVGGFTAILANITDNLQLDTSNVYLRVKYPDGTSIDNHMTYISSTGEFNYTFSDTSQFGRFNFTIIASDTTGNINSSIESWFVTTRSNSSLILIHGGYNGTAANDATLWDTTSFPGLDVNEILEAQNISNRTILQNNLWYNTSRQIVQYTLNSEKSMLVENALDINGTKVPSGGGYYARIGWQGIPYVALNGKANKTSLLILEQSSPNDKKTLASQERWDMGEGYTLKAESIDANASPRQVRFNLSKNGVKLDDKVLQGGDVYNYSSTAISGETNVPMFVTYVDSIFTGTTSDMVQLRYTWLISDNVTVINASDVFGNLKVDQSNSSFLNLTNSINLSLARNSNIDIMDKLHFKATDNASLEYYPCFDSPISVNATPADVTLEIFRDSGAAGSIKVTKYSNITPEMNQSLPETPFGKYISLETNNNIINNRTWLKFKVYYTQAELTASGLDESSLKIAWYNKSDDSWVTLVAGFPVWVYGTGADTSDSGGYAGHVWVNITNFSAFGSVAFERSTFDFGTFALIGTSSAAPVSSTNTGGSGSGGSGGGGGGGTSGENYSNIELKEKRDMYIFKDKVASYKFNTTDPILYVNITGNISAGEVTTMVEILRNTSSLVKNTSAPGIVYKNMNIWVGTSGFAIPKNIQKGAIRFRVTNSWLEENELARSDVRLVKWGGSRWIELDTYETTNGSEHIYYEAVTDSFSPFAITAIRSAPQPVEAIDTPVASHETPVPEEAKAGEKEISGLNGILLVATVVLMIIVTILAAVYLKEKKKI